MEFLPRNLSSGPQALPHCTEKKKTKRVLPRIDVDDTGHVSLACGLGWMPGQLLFVDKANHIPKKGSVWMPLIWYNIYDINKKDKC